MLRLVAITVDQKHRYGVQVLKQRKIELLRLAEAKLVDFRLVRLTDDGIGIVQQADIDVVGDIGLQRPEQFIFHIDKLTKTPRCRPKYWLWSGARVCDRLSPDI